MLDGNAVVAAARQEAAPAVWQVWHARRGYFVRIAVIGVVFAALAAFGAAYLMGHPDTVFVLGTNVDPPAEFITGGAFVAWRVADFVVLAGFAVLGVYLGIRHAVNVVAGRGQVLVIMPEGLVVGTGATPRVIPFVSLSSLSAVVARGSLRLDFRRADGKKGRMILDGRFGRPRPIAQAILRAYGQARGAARP